MRVSILSAALLAVLATTATVRADEVRGVALLQPGGCPVSNLTVEIDPAVGSPQTKVLTSTGSDGSFTARVLAGKYLVMVFQQSVKVYQAEVFVNGTTDIPSISLASRPGTPSKCGSATKSVGSPTGQTADSVNATRFSLRRADSTSARPVDLTLDGDSTFLILDSTGGVRRVTKDSSGFHSGLLFALEPFDHPVSVAATNDYVLVAANSNGGCRVYTFQKAVKHLSTKALGLKRCTAIATDGPEVLMTYENEEEVRVWADSSFAKSRSLSASGLRGPSTLNVDPNTNDVFIGDSSGDVFAVSPTSKAKKFEQNAGASRSVGVGAARIVVVTNGSMNCYDRRSLAKQSTNCLGTKLKGDFTGVRIDSVQNAWFVDQKTNELLGPYPVK